MADSQFYFLMGAKYTLPHLVIWMGTTDPGLVLDLVLA